MTEATSSGCARRPMMQDEIGVSSSSFLRACGSGALPKCISVTIPARCYGIDANAVVNELIGHCFCHGNQACFDRIIDQHVLATEESPFRGGVDDCAALFFLIGARGLRLSVPNLLQFSFRVPSF